MGIVMKKKCCKCGEEFKTGYYGTTKGHRIVLHMTCPRCYRINSNISYELTEASEHKLRLNRPRKAQG